MCIDPNNEAPKVAHTPGPWFADKIVDRSAFNIFPNGATHALLEVAPPAHDGAHPFARNVEANARLIAAAPELLAALKGLLAVASDSRGVAGYHLNGDVADWGDFPEWHAACAAVAKAEARP